MMENISGTKGYTVKDRIEKSLLKAGSRYPSLRAPLSLVNIYVSDNAFLASDGLDIYCGEEQRPSDEDIQHLLVHCIYRHMLPPEKALPLYWDLACDISAEYIRSLLFPSEEKKDRELRTYIEDVLPDGTKPENTLSVYRALMDMFEDDTERLKGLFRRDDHSLWYSPEHAIAKLSEKRSRPPADAEEISAPAPYRSIGEDVSHRYLEEMLTERWYSADEIAAGETKTNRYGLAPGSREEKMVLRREGKYDFSKYLRRFSSTWEEMKLDFGAFDYIPYYYGMKRYGNMPLIEPLEYSESHKIEDLVIAIDTSGSCSKETVERFLSEIEGILMQRDFFFKKMNVHIVQCDSKVQSHVQIHSYEEWAKYIKELTVKGRGGTDFNPVFDLVDRLRQRGKLKNLKGLLYFTDGDGVYPEKETPYETAFVFTTRAALAYPYPDWITPLCLDMEGPKVPKIIAASLGGDILERRKTGDKR